MSAPTATSVAAPEGLHRVDVHARARATGRGEHVRHRLDDAGLGVHRLHRDEPHPALAERALEVVEVEEAIRAHARPSEPAPALRARAPRRRA